ncbi:hypothetical protein EGR_09544 [Echinococcus granulosus]|uniref:Uncharacterized protein n=1 Tax=Echinococcus granulosus TaxID=6210 RepID=W6UQD1_ECHGR|nr:hypothetical protein EGR_09544 [Echinococcus granulosus]EUB55604.1 hypothetical protein EGR_09544 [Echinococcus granulosus]
MSLQDVHELYASSLDQMEGSEPERRFCEVLRICSQSAVFFPFRLSLPMVLRLLPLLSPPPPLLENSTLTSFILSSFHRFMSCTVLFPKKSRRLHTKKGSSKERAAYRFSMETLLSDEFCRAERLIGIHCPQCRMAMTETATICVFAQQFVKKAPTSLELEELADGVQARLLYFLAFEAK